MKGLETRLLMAVFLIVLSVLLAVLFASIVLNVDIMKLFSV